METQTGRIDRGLIWNQFGTVIGSPDWNIVWAEVEGP